MNNEKLKFLRACSSNEKIFYTNIFNQIIGYIDKGTNTPDEPYNAEMHDKFEERICVLVNMYPELWYIGRQLKKSFPPKYITLADLLHTYGFNKAFMCILNEKDALRVKSVIKEPILKLFFLDLQRTDVTERFSVLGNFIKKHKDIIDIKDKKGNDIRYWVEEALIFIEAVLKDTFPDRKEMINKNEIAVKKLKNVLLEIENERA